MGKLQVRFFAEVLLIGLLIGKSFSEIYDVTTVCKYEKTLIPNISEGKYHLEYEYNENLKAIEVHTRNNAFSMPLLLNNEEQFDTDANYGVDIQPCIPYFNKCTWEQENFSNRSFTDDEIPFNSTETLHYDDITGEEKSFMKFFGNIRFNFKTSSPSGCFTVFLTDKKGSLYSSDMYYIRICNDYNYMSLFIKCSAYFSDEDISDYEETNIYVGNGDRRCIIMKKKNLENLHWESFEEHIHDTYNHRNLNVYSMKGPYTVKISVENGQVIVIDVAWKNSYKRLFQVLDISPIEIKYISFGARFMSGFLSLRPSSLLQLSEEEGLLKSPSFKTMNEKICVSVTYYKESPNTQDISLNAVWSENEKQNLKLLNVVKLVDDWKIETYSIEVPEEKKLTPLTVEVIASGPKEYKFIIARVAGCNAEDLEDVLILSESANLKLPESGFDVAVIEKEEHSKGEELCLNGGLYNDFRKGCICPAGFTGETCEIGCGENMYGFNCEGVCSVTNKGCKGMKLCHPYMPCTCAAGLKGHFCNSTCDEGTYGSDCLQKCGFCSNSTCDPYTGLCSSGCEPGYYPPYCQKSYKYITAYPEAKETDFYSLKLKSTLHSMYQTGAGNPVFYQFQYRDLLNPYWSETEPKLITKDDATVNITGLLPATKYEIRLILLDADGGSYQGNNILSTLVRTNCKVPDSVNYNLEIDSITEDGFKLFWNYTADSPTWCPVIHYEVEMKRKWWSELYYKVTTSSTEFVDLLPGQQFSVRIRAVTIDGAAPFSDILPVKTKYKAPGRVLDIKVVLKTSKEVKIKWLPPAVTSGKISNYKVTYHCQKILACKTEDCSYSSGEVEVSTTSILLQGLLAHTQYLISVSAEAETWGPSSQILVATEMTDSVISPDENFNSPVTEQTNSSFTVHWKPPENCTYINGYLNGYRFELHEIHGLNVSTFIKEGTTEDTKATFNNLNPHTDYVVKVFLVTLRGWNSNHPLFINVTTRATTPSSVQDLTVYKRGREMVGLRWATPKFMFGEIESFTITYKKTNSQNAAAYMVMPKPCVAWSHLYCHDLNGLQHDSEYIIQVQARNTEVAEDGESSNVTTYTKEGAPTSPRNLRVQSQTQTSLIIEWEPPYMINGVLKSYLVNFEETDSFNISACCQHSLMQQIVVSSEQAKHHVQFTGLRPASTYTISVSATTTAMGPAIALTAHTLPPIPIMNNTIKTLFTEGLTTKPILKINPIKEYHDLVREYLVLIIPDSSDGTDTTVTNTWFNQEITQLVKSSFYIAAEIKQADMHENTEIQLGTKSEQKIGKWGMIQNPVLEKGEFYRIGIAAILEYCGVFSVGYIATDAMKVK